MKRECYEIITDQEALTEFIDWLPELGDNEKFYACLFGRKKYAKDAGVEIPWIKSDKGQLKRFLADKDFLQQKIEQLECPVGAYQFNGNAFPQECLALYITPNPRDLFKSIKGGQSKLIEMVWGQARNCNPQAEMMSEIQRTPTNKKTFATFDVDIKDENMMKRMVEIVDGYCDVIETRGGYHIHVHLKHAKTISNGLWYPTLMKMPDVDVSGDCMTPVVGTYQGGHSPRFVYRYKE